MSLTSCLKKAGSALRPADKTAILALSRTYRAEGLSADDAGKKAIAEQIAVVQGLMAAEKPALIGSGAKESTKSSNDTYGQPFKLTLNSLFQDVPYRASAPYQTEPGESILSSEILTKKVTLSKADQGRTGFDKEVLAWRISVIQSKDGGIYSAIEGMARDSGRTPAGEVVAYFEKALDPDALAAIAPSIANEAIKAFEKANKQDLTAPTKQDVLDQQDRKDNADKLDEKDQIKRESEVGDSSFMTGVTGDARQDTTGSIFDAAPEPRVEPASSRVLDDVGEKLGGARKDMTPSLSKALTDDYIATEPFSKVWPADEVDAIEDAFVAAVAQTARDSVPSKPRVAYKVKNWVEKVKIVRDLAAKISDGTVTKSDFMNKMQAVRGLDGFRAKVTLLEALDRSNWKRIGEVGEFPNSYRYETDGTKTATPMVRVEIDGRNVNFDGKSVADVIEKVAASLGEAAPDKRMQFEVRGNSTSVSINKKGDKEYRKLKTLANSKEAFAYIKDNYNDLVTAWEGVKETDNVKETDVRNAENRPRTGADHRQGKDVTAEEFRKTFGFRGVEFGNWVEQGSNAKARQGMINQAYDALQDLAAIIGVPPKAISLNGTLGLGFGSRGSGTASAHYEPDTLVINLTKTKGAGVLAHEWFHALDNYFAHQRGGEVKIKPGLNAQTAYRQQNYITYQAEPMMVRQGRSALPPMRKFELERLHKVNPNDARFDPQYWQPDPTHPAGVRPEVEKAFADLVKTLNESPMAARAAMNDKAAEGYWSRIIERAARSFENYIISKMQEQGYDNDYLANVRQVQDFPRAKERYPYLMPEEVAPIAKAFDGLFSTIQTKESADGNVAMFAIDPQEDSLAKFARMFGTPKGMTVKAAQAVVDRIAAKWTDGPRITVVATTKDLPARLDIGKANPRGVYQGNDVWIVAGNNANADWLARTLAHEAIAHYGLRKMLSNADWKQLMGNIQLAIKSGNKPLGEIQAQVKEIYKAQNLRPEYEADEIAARVVEAAVDAATGEFKPGFGFVKQVYAKIAAFLRDLGINVPFTVQELHGMLVSAMKNMEAGTRTQGGGDLVVAAAQDSGGAQFSNSSASSLNQVTDAWDAVGIRNFISEKNGTIELSQISVPLDEREKGVGTKAMQQLADYADASGQRIVVTPTPPLSKNKSRLISFYKNFGFVENSGKSKDFSTRHTMIREPIAGGAQDAGQADAKFATMGSNRESNDAATIQQDQAKVNRLSAIVARALNTSEPAGTAAYRAVSVPGGSDLRTVAAAFGKTVVTYSVAPVLKGTKSPFSTIGGVSVGSIPDTVFINSDNDRPHLSVLGHELAHEMRRDSPETYAELVEAIRPYIKQNDYQTKFTEERVAIERVNAKDWDGMREEFIGEVLSDGFTEPAFWNAIGEQSPTLLAKVVGAVGQLIDKARRTFGAQRRTSKYLTDFDKVMQIAGKAMATYAARPVTASQSTDDGPSFARMGDQTDTPAQTLSADLADFNKVAITLEDYAPNEVEIVNLEAKSKNQGDGTKAMQAITASADRHAINLMLIPAGNTLKQERLIDFYERFGFQSDGDVMRRRAASKSNNGNFDTTNSSIMLAAGAPAGAQTGLFAPNVWNMPAETRTDKFLYEMQDNKVDLKRAQAAIKESGGVIAEKYDARLAETLYPGRVASRSDAFLDVEGKPLLKAMTANKVDMNELADYLHARGAEERNKQVAKVNPAMPDGGAGTNTKGTLLTTQAARDYLANITPTRKMVLDAMAKRVDTITAGTRKLLVSEGLEKQETIDAWEGAYKNYVPMFRDEANEAMPSHATGSGFTVKGSASKRATGSTKEVTNILAHVLMQREAAITRAEKNRVALALYGQALSHPNPEFWTTIKPSMTAAEIAKELKAMGVDPMTAAITMEGAPTIRMVDPVTNTVVNRLNPSYKTMPGAITLKVNAEDRVLMLNTTTERGMRLAASLKNLDGLTQLDLAGSIVGRSTRFLAAVNTQYNPAFGLVNLTRDVLGGVINLGSTELRGNALKVLAKTPIAIFGIARELATGAQSGKWGKLYQQFVADGGQTGFKDNFRDPNDRAKAIEKELKALGRSKLSPGRATHAMLDLLDGFNTSLENAVRLSAYSAALDKGMSRPEAARLGRELTADFNRKGRAGRELGPLYAFFNASVQGTARTIVTLKGPTGAKIIAGGLGLGVLQALMLAAAGYDDDEIPEFVKTRALIIPLLGGGEKRYIAVHYPLGLNVLPNTGRVLAELTLNGGKDIQKRTVAAIGEIAGAFNPMGGGNIFTADGALKTIAPTLIDPVIELGFNQNFAGSRIEKEGYGGETDGRPGQSRVKEATLRSTTGQAYLGISKAINAATGGSDYEKGVISWTPERYRYLAQTVGGGVLRELEKTINASTASARGDKVKSSQIPVLGRFYGEVDDDQVAQSRYYERSEAIKTAESSYKAAIKAGDDKAIERMEESTPELMMARTFARTQQNISKLNKLAVQVVNDPAEMREIDTARTELMKSANEAIAEMEREGGKVTLADRLRKTVAPKLAEAQ